MVTCIPRGYDHTPNPLIAGGSDDDNNGDVGGGDESL